MLNLTIEENSVILDNEKKEIERLKDEFRHLVEAYSTQIVKKQK